MKPRWFIVLALTMIAADWPQFHGPTRDGHSPETGLLEHWPKDGPKRLWTADLGRGWSAPAVVGNRVILHHRVGDDEVLECWSASDGKPLWKVGAPTGYIDDFNFDDGPRATPAISGDHVWTLGAEGRLACHRVKDGSTVWHKALGLEFKPAKGYFGIANSPVVDDKAVYILVGAKEAGVAAFDRMTGTLIWKAGKDEAGYSSPILATLNGKTHLVCFTREGLLVLDSSNGTVVHERHFRARAMASVNAAAPLVSRNQIFITSSYNTGALLLGFSNQPPKEIWANDRSLSCHYNTPVKVGEFLYGIHGRQEGGTELRCIAWSTGEVKWKQPGFGCATLIAVDGKILAATEGGELVLFDAHAEAYRERARFQAMTKPVRAAIALSDGRLFARDNQRLSAWQVGKK